MNKQTTNAAKSAKPLSVWELPKLLQSVHEFRQGKVKGAKERSHYPGVLAFVHRSRFAICSQIRRRFSDDLPSDRTARRHLAELESLGFLDTVQPPSPLWPKTFYCTGRGVRRLRRAYAEKGIEWHAAVIDRHRREAFSPAHVCHELSITEVGLLAWELTQERDDLELLAVERRSLANHPAFKIGLAGRSSQLVPDGMFLLRQKRKGMMICFQEIDLGNMSERQWKGKLRRYEAWGSSEAGRRWLSDCYVSHGASSPRPVFRVLVVAGSKRRKMQLVEWSHARSEILHRRLWFTCKDDLEADSRNVIPLAPPTTRQIVV